MVVEGAGGASAPADVLSVAVGTSFRRQKYLLAFATPLEVRNYVRTQAAKVERARLPEIIAAWGAAQPKVQALIKSESGIADTTSVEDVPSNRAAEISSLLDNELIRKTYQLPTSLGIVEIDTLVASQRAYDFDFVEQLRAKYPSSPTFDDLVDICLSPRQALAPIQHLEIAPNVHIFSSPSTDFRFLGSFFKELTPDDYSFAEAGGVPAAAIVCFVGYGAYPVNVYRYGRRVVLNNGFHRVNALRSLGVERIPVVIQEISNPQLEFPDHLRGIPREYMLFHERPVLVKDFFNDDFVTVIKVGNRIRAVAVQVQAILHDIPS